jgi:hypothetical protein
VLELQLNIGEASPKGLVNLAKLLSEIQVQSTLGYLCIDIRPGYTK